MSAGGAAWKAEGEDELLAAIGSATVAFAGIDTGLVFVLGALLAPVPSAGIAAELASVFIYGTRSFEQKIELINGTFHARYYHVLRNHKNDNARRAIEYQQQLMGRVFTAVGDSKWVRNLAAHGSMKGDGSTLRLAPSLYDFKSFEKLKKRKSGDGLTADQLSREVAKLRMCAEHVMLLSLVMKNYTQFYPATVEVFLEPANELGAALKLPPLRLHDHSSGPPRRQRRAARTAR